MKYLLTLLLVCPFAHASDSVHSLIGGPSPLGRPGTPLSRSMSLMPSMSTHSGAGHRRDRSRSHITEPAPSDEANPAFVPCPIALTRSTSTMLHALGGHRGGIIPQVTVAEQIPQPEFANPDEETTRLREQNDMLNKQLAKLQNMHQLLKDKDALEAQMLQWKAKREALLLQEEQIAQRVQYANGLVENLGEIAVTVAGLDTRAQTKELTTAIGCLTLLTRHMEALQIKQEEMQKKYQQFMAKVEQFMEQQRIHAQLMEQKKQAQLRQDAASSQPTKPSSGLVGLSEMFSFKKT